MKYKVTLNNRVYEVEVEAGEAMLVDEYEAKAPVAAAPAAVTEKLVPFMAVVYIVCALIVVIANAKAVPGAIKDIFVCAFNPAAAGAGDPVKSPMPGNILKIVASVGQQVNEGDTIIVLEAMKMENDIVASKSGKVSQILVTKGQVVETGAQLAVIS